MISNVGFIKSAEVVRIASALPYFAAVVKTAADAVTKVEQKNIAEALKKVAPKSETEENVQRLAGRPFTPGQYLRYGAVGTGMGAFGHVAGSAITHDPAATRWRPWVLPSEKAEMAAMDAIEAAAKRTDIQKDIAKAVLNPRQLARAGVMGAVFGLGVPMLRRLSDIHAARKGKY